jgi:SNF family Na+-dependent transporter
MGFVLVATSSAIGMGIKGVENGIERVNKFMIPALLLLFLFSYKGYIFARDRR